MRALVATRYGGNDVLELTEAPDPKVGPDSVLVRTRAVGVNPVDWKIVGGHLDGAFPTHFPLIPGWDVAGAVQAVGPAVTRFGPGDDPLAYDREDHIQRGTLAELVAVPLRCVAAKPAGLSWVDAAALPLAGLTAYQCVHEGVGGSPAWPTAACSRWAGATCSSGPTRADAAELARLPAAGELRVPVRETFGFAQAVDVLARVEGGARPGQGGRRLRQAAIAARRPRTTSRSGP